MSTGRLEDIMEVILAIAANDFSRRAAVGDGEDLVDGIATGLNMLAEEIGRQRKLEDQFRASLLRSERLAAVGTLAAGVAHEVNNPSAFLLSNFVALDDHVTELRDELHGLHEVVGADRLRHAEQLLDELAEIARVGHEGVDRIANIVRGLRNFARIEADAISSVRLDQVATQAYALVSREILHRARFTRILAPVPPRMGDRTKLTQLVTNLLLNAAHAIPEGDPEHNEVAIETRVEGDEVLLRVSDTGHGIPEELRAKVFEPFFTTKQGGQGTGLGLSISADIARQHRGELRFESAVGRGTTFELRLPADTGLQPTAASRPPSPVQVHRLRVLFIDDEEELLRAYQRMLRKSHEVVCALGGAAAIELLGRDRAFDAIVCDLLMPGVDGPAVWAWIEANAPELRARTLFCSGGAFTGRAAAFAEEQKHRLLDKPLGRAHLTTAIAGVTQR